MCTLACVVFERLVPNPTPVFKQVAEKLEKKFQKKASSL
jgi:hypothetical protein